MFSTGDQRKHVTNCPQRNKMHLRGHLDGAVSCFFAHLRRSIDIVFILQQEGSSFYVIFLCGNVEGWQTHFSPRIILKQNGNHFVVTLLECNGQWCESILRKKRE